MTDRCLPPRVARTWHGRRAYLVIRAMAVRVRFGENDRVVDVMEASLAGSVLLLVMAIAMGITAIWDIGGMASKMRGRLEERSLFGGLYRRMPSWTFRAFGVWCIIFGIGQLVYVWHYAGRVELARFSVVGEHAAPCTRQVVPGRRRGTNAPADPRGRSAPCCR